MGDVDLAIINGTQESLGKWLKKPPLTEKLLRKPPFKFLHDIITTIIDSTGFMRDVYQPEELNSENIKDREAKIEFLQKAVDHVALVTGKNPTIRPNKTVAGHEAEKTNQFLQMLAQAIQLHKEQLAGDDPIKDKPSNVKSPIKKHSERDKRELQKSNSKEKLLKPANGVESPKASPSKRKLTADQSRPERASKSKSERDAAARSSEKTSKSRPTENGNLKRVGGSKDRSPEKSRTRATDGLSGETRKAASKEKSSRDRNASDAKDRVDNGKVEKKHKSKETTKDGRGSKETKEDLREKKGTTKDRKESKERKENTKDQKERSKERNESSKERKESSKERKESSKDRNESSKERREGSKELKESTKDRNDREERNSGEHQTSKDLRRGSVAKTLETVPSAIHSPRRKSSVQNESPKSSAVLSGDALGSPRQADTLDSPEPIVNQILPPTRPLTTRLDSAIRSQRTELPPSDVEQIPPKLQQQQEPDTNRFYDGDANKRPSTSTIRKASARPSTARPAAPKVRVVGTAQEEPPSNEPIATVSNIILEKGDAKDDDEDDGFRVEESDNALVGQDQPPEIGSVDDLKGKEHGSLVTQILDTKKDLETGSLRPVTGFRGTNIDRQPMSDSTKRKERELLCREMDRLREGVQTVTRCANPLGKLVDYLQEDVDTMLKELDMWRSESQKYEASLQREQSKVHVELESLQNQLQELEEAIDVQGSKICAVKANILHNEERIQKMMSLGRL